MRRVLYKPEQLVGLPRGYYLSYFENLLDTDPYNEMCSGNYGMGEAMDSLKYFRLILGEEVA